MHPSKPAWVSNFNPQNHSTLVFCPLQKKSLRKHFSVVNTNKKLPRAEITYMYIPLSFLLKLQLDTALFVLLLFDYQARDIVKKPDISVFQLIISKTSFQGCKIMLKQLEGPEESSWLHKKWNCGFSPHTLSAKKYPLFNHRENIVVLGRSSWAGCTFPAGYRRQDASQCVTITTQKTPSPEPFSIQRKRFHLSFSNAAVIEMLISPPFNQEI